MASTLTPGDLLALDIDLRLGEVMLEAWQHGAWDQELATLFRLAYGRGYSDALIEPVYAQLCRDHGLAVPVRPKEKKRS